MKPEVPFRSTPASCNRCRPGQGVADRVDQLEHADFVVVVPVEGGTVGDTITIHGQSVRLAGIDAPESAQTCTRASKPWRCGQQAAKALDGKLADRPVRCESLGTDRYGRMLGRCRVGREDLGAWMVRNGWALAFVRYSSDYVSEERAAEKAQVGIWAGSFTPPWEWRAQRRAVPAAGSSAAPRSGCLIKGNVSRDGERIFHRPGQRDYARTQINPPRSEISPRELSLRTLSALVRPLLCLTRCGAFNDRLVTFARESLAASGVDAGDRLVLTIGARADASWRAEAEPPAGHEEAPATVEALAHTVGAVLTRLDHWREEKSVERLVLFYHRPGEEGRAVPVRARLLPIDPLWLEALHARPWGSRRLPISIGPPEALLRHLIRQLLFARVFTAVIQSRTAEHAERLAAMQAADRSIADTIDDLHVTHRQKRQNVITAELLDIISGYEAITGHLRP